MSEFTLIDTHFKHATERHLHTLLGIGDDCAISRVPPDCELVSCVDTLIMGRHFPTDTTAHAIGFKSVAVNLSDLAAMGATPYGILLGLSLPSELANSDWLYQFTSGLSDICKLHDVELIGGDTTRSDVLMVCITALGFVKQGQGIKRNGAKIGDVICVSGQIGAASYALSQILQNKDTPLHHYLAYPVPQVALGQRLIGVANSMIDVSDGLGQDLGHILTQSQVGAKLHVDKIPCVDELNTLQKMDKYQHILNGGDDYHLCFTLSQENFMQFNQDNPNTIFAIGEIIKDQELQLLDNGRPMAFSIRGWAHF